MLAENGGRVKGGGGLFPSVEGEDAVHVGLGFGYVGHAAGLGDAGGPGVVGGEGEAQVMIFSTPYCLNFFILTRVVKSCVTPLSQSAPRILSLISMIFVPELDVVVGLELNVL